MARAEIGPEERWISSLKKALVKAGVTVDAIAGAIHRALTAERKAVGEDGEVVSLGDHHAVQLKAASLTVDLHVPRRANQNGGERTMLVVQAGAKVQLCYFGEAKDPLEPPEAPGATGTIPAEPMSATAKQHLIRSGQMLPDGSVPEAPKALETSKALPEGTDRGEGWLK